MTVRTTLIALILGSCAHLTPALEMEVVFRDAKGLAVGGDVRMGDARVGEVRSLEKRGDGVAVGIVVDEQHRNRVTAESVFHVERAGLLSGDRYVAIEPGAGTAVRDGVSVRGQDSLVDRITGWAKQTAAWLTSDELRDGLADFEEAVRSAAAGGADAFDDARPVLEERGAELVELAREHGPEVADKMKTVVDAILEAARD